jgi:protein-S-isoprenylcysteine O-methyltransferase Ste14
MVVRMIVQNLASFGVMGAVLFLSAGTFHWPGAWVYLVVMIGLGLASGLLLARHDPGLLKERLGSPVQKAQTTADKVVTSVLFVLIFGWLALMGLDAVRFGWSAVPVWAQVIGLLSLLLSIWIVFRTMRENSFAAPVVKIQKDRGHRVITTGPYGYVRHPMYFGALFFFIGTSLVLGSWWGLAFTLVFATLLCIRIPIEERALRAGLEGYDAYAARVRYRLIPLIW